MYPTLILPGFNGSSEEHWQRHWAREQANAFVVEQKDWNCPIIEDWQAELDGALEQTEGAFLVAHSLGCLLAASYASRPQASKIVGALLVAPCALDVTLQRHPCMIEFGEEPLAKLPFPSLVIGSLNDPYMSFDELLRRVGGWGSDVVILGFAGHINVASGFGRWHGGYRLFERLKKTAERKYKPGRAASVAARREARVG